MSTEQLEVVVDAPDADGAIAEAKKWAKAEPNLRLRTIAKVERFTGGPVESHSRPDRWLVRIAVEWL